MRVVIDANVLIAILVKPGIPIDLFFNIELEVFAPQLLFKEVENHRKEIIEKSQLTEEDFDLLYVILKNNITIIAEEEFLDYREEAEKICPDLKDIVYFALALNLKCGIWSNDKKLKEQKDIKVYATHELIHLFNII